MNEPGFENWSATVQNFAELRAEERSRRRLTRALLREDRSAEAADRLQAARDPGTGWPGCETCDD